MPNHMNARTASAKMLATVMMMDAVFDTGPLRSFIASMKKLSAATADCPETVT